MSSPEGTNSLQRLEVALEVLANLLYLAKHEPPASARQMSYLLRAEEELASLRPTLADLPSPRGTPDAPGSQ
jgi:hypothetical protein